MEIARLKYNLLRSKIFYYDNYIPAFCVFVFYMTLTYGYGTSETYKI